MTKYEWRKVEQAYYLPKKQPCLIEIPMMKYITVAGKGNPNNQDFKDKVSLLYTLAYAVRMMPKNGYTPADYFEYTVYPLEGIWAGIAQDKDGYSYKIMIRQPDFVDSEVFERAQKTAEKKQPSQLLAEAKLEEFQDGLCLQMMHIGSYDDEPRSFTVMDEYLKENNYQRTTSTHKEIYLSDPNKTAIDKLMTVLRYFISA